MAKKRIESRPVKRPQNWFLRGWEYQSITRTDGTVKQELVYTREYYKLTAAHPARVKCLAAALYITLCAVYLGFETTLSQGGLAWYAGAPCLLAVIPLFYLGLGVWNLVRAERYFTYRRLRAAYTRLRIGGWGVCVLLGLGTAGQLMFLLRYRRLLTLRPELIMLFGAALGALLAAGLLILTKKASYEEVSRKEYPGENRGN